MGRKIGRIWNWDSLIGTHPSQQPLPRQQGSVPGAVELAVINAGHSRQRVDAAGCGLGSSLVPLL